MTWRWLFFSNSLSILRSFITVERKIQRWYLDEYCRTGRPFAYNVATKLPPPRNECCQSPVFWAISAEGVEMFLESGLRDMKLTNDGSDGMPLLHCCIIKEIASKKIVTHLSDQIGLEWKGSTAIDLGRQIR